MSFEEVKLVHPKTGVAVTATTAVDLTTFRYDGGYVPVDVARQLVQLEGADKKWPALAEGLKALDEAEAEVEVEVEVETPEKPEAKAAPKPTSGTKTSAAKTGAEKSGTDAAGNQVGVN